MKFLKSSLMVVFGVILNLAIAFEYLNFWHVKNYLQPLFYFGWLGVLIFLVIGFIVFKKLKLAQKYSILVLLIVVGMLSNIAERLYQGYVIDYLNLGIGVLNLADLQIYFGLVAIIFNEFRAQKIDKN